MSKAKGCHQAALRLEGQKSARLQGLELEGTTPQNLHEGGWAKPVKMASPYWQLGTLVLPSSCIMVT